MERQRSKLQQWDIPEEKGKGHEGNYLKKEGRRLF